jgi:uncharacterized membrane protein YkoI
MRLVAAAFALVLGFAPVLRAAPIIRAAEAERLALRRVAGVVVHEKLRTTKKGRQVYSIKIKARGAATTGSLTKVEIDAASGRVLHVKEVPNRRSREEE